jgi:hypothetical protein
MKLFDWLFSLEEISGDGRCSTYMYRWTIWRFGDRKLYLHHFVGSDWTRDLHDHPKRFLSFGLWGSYIEETPQGERLWSALGFGPFRRLTSNRLRSTNCWTLVFVLKTVRRWGFYSSEGWIPWKRYLKTHHADSRKDC